MSDKNSNLIANRLVNAFLKNNQFTMISNKSIKLDNALGEFKIIGSRTMGEACNFKDYIKARKSNIYQCQGRIRLATARECYLACKWIKKNNKKFNTPFLLIHSKKDKVTSVVSSKNFYENCSSKDKHLIILDEGNHSILVPQHEEDYIPDIVLSKITNWINHRI